MDFEQAKKAHFDWKAKLSAYIKNPDGSLKAPDVGVDNKCALGQWIYGEGKQYSHMPAYKTLVSQHARFHKAAADVIIKVDQGQSVKEELAIGGKSDFGDASTAVIVAINTISRETK